MKNDDEPRQDDDEPRQGDARPDLPPIEDASSTARLGPRLATSSNGLVRAPSRNGDTEDEELLNRPVPP
ncbi:MAG: hypothetical protein IRY99_13270, partial [Isosphaeraceae bacterium]|nr:hypothetical protein [Isosphaeraceae bacterium]